MRSAVRLQVDVDVRRLGVSQRVDQPLLHHAVDRRASRSARGRAERSWSQGQRDGRIASLPVAHEVLERFGKSQRIQRQRHQARDEPVHGVVEPRRPPRRSAARRRSCGGCLRLRGDGHAPGLRMAVTDWPNSSCSSCAIRRRSSSTRCSTSVPSRAALRAASPLRAPCARPAPCLPRPAPYG